MKETPTSVLVLAIIGIVVASLGILGSCMGLVSTFVDLTPNPIMDTLRKDHVYITLMLISIVIALGINVWLLTASIGSIRRRPWARQAMLIFAWASIVQTILGVIFQVAYILPKMLNAMTNRPPAEVMVVRMSMFATPCFAVLWLAFPVCVLYFFTRPHVIEAFIPGLDDSLLPPAAPGAEQSPESLFP